MIPLTDQLRWSGSGWNRSTGWKSGRSRPVDAGRVDGRRQHPPETPLDPDRHQRLPLSHDPDTLVKQLASDASTLWIVQVLGAWEADPTPLGGRRLVDNETASEADLLINQASIDEYLERLHRLQRGLVQASRRAEASFVTVQAEAGLEQACRDDLCAAGMLRVA
ncbi:MAG: hypothetical protein Ct9H300mP1_13840 [Planctomycetaceae bacterium]|nr:MAG: hypothetical protein Ct9H300mP1_13840 [Planctomycetaceae bacterium]